MQYLNQQTGKLYSEEDLQIWIDNFYGAFESNVPKFKRPTDAFERVRRVFNLKEVDTNVHSLQK